MPCPPICCCRGYSLFSAAQPHVRSRDRCPLKAKIPPDCPIRPRSRGFWYSGRLWNVQPPYPRFFPPPLALSCTLMLVESMLRFSMSASCDSARNIASNTPLSLHLAKRAYTDCHGPYASGSSRHWAPLRATHSIPFSMTRLSFPGRPRFPVRSGGNRSLIRSHWLLVSSYRFMLPVSLILDFCATFLFQTSPNVNMRKISYLYSFSLLCVR